MRSQCPSPSGPFAVRWDRGTLLILDSNPAAYAARLAICYRFTVRRWNGSLCTISNTIRPKRLRSAAVACEIFSTAGRSDDSNPRPKA